MSTDALYGSCIDETLKLYHDSNMHNHETRSGNINLVFPQTNSTYKYLFKYKGRNSMLGTILSGNYFNVNNLHPSLSFDSEMNQILNSAVCHGDELFHLFNLKFASRKPEDNRDKLTQRRLLMLWTDFAKHRSVSPSCCTLP